MNNAAAVPERPIIFVSCGQYTEEERQLGEAIAELITEHTEAEGYFAQNQSSLEGVSDHILRALGRCVGFVGIMHHRGSVSALDTQQFTRASVWVEQEIAIAAYIVRITGTPISVQLYIQDGIRLEGLREKVLLNAVSFNSNADVLDHFRAHVKSVFGALPVRELRNELNLESPLGQKPFPAISLNLGAVNPDFIVGARVRPVSYLKERRLIDADDERFIEEVGARSRGRSAQTNLHAPMTMRRIINGVVLSTPDPGQRRPDGLPVQPDQQIEIDSDGDITIRFAQDDNSPLFQYLAVIGIAYTFVEQLYPRLGLEPRAHVDIVLHLHAGRVNHTPVLPTDFRESATLDLRVDGFVSAFSDLTLQLFRASNYSSSRDDVRKTLERFAAESLP